MPINNSNLGDLPRGTYRLGQPPSEPLAVCSEPVAAPKLRSMITDDDRIVAAWAEHCSGPGWSNSIIWVLKSSDDGKLDIEAIQPEDQTPEMRAIFDVSAAATRAMMRAVNMLKDQAERM